MLTQGPLGCFDKISGQTILGHAMGRPRQRQNIASMRRTFGDKPPTTLDACATICFHLREEKCAAFVWKEKSERRCVLQHIKGSTDHSTAEIRTAVEPAEGEDAYFWPKVFAHEACDISRDIKITQVLQQGTMIIHIPVRDG